MVPDGVAAAGIRLEVERLREEKRELTRRATEAEGRLKEVEVECITQLDGLADENARLCEENKSLLARVSTLQSMNLQLAGQVAELEGRRRRRRRGGGGGLKVQAQTPERPGGGGGGGGEPGALINDLVQARRATVVADGSEAAGAGDAAAAAEAAAGQTATPTGTRRGARRAARQARGRGAEHPALRRGSSGAALVGAKSAPSASARSSGGRTARAGSVGARPSSAGTSHTKKGATAPADKRTLPRRSSWHSGRPKAEGVSFRQ